MEHRKLNENNLHYKFEHNGDNDNAFIVPGDQSEEADRRSSKESYWVTTNRKQSKIHHLSISAN